MRDRRRRTFALTAAFLCGLVASQRVAVAAIQPAAGPHAMVATTNEAASRIALEVMRKGGNAVDAAVAAALALAVLWPRAGNLGGGGFMLVRMADGKSEVIDYRETAPRAASRNMYLDGKGIPVPGASSVGYRSVAVPGTVAGLALALERHGTRSFAELVAPAQKLASDGYLIDQQAAESFRTGGDHLAAFDDSRRIFLGDGKMPKVGQRLVQPELAATLSRLAVSGPREFYTGETARRIVADMKVHGGLITDEDLRDYRPVVRVPLEGSYRGLRILTVPPPSAGGVALLEALNQLEGYPLRDLGFHSADEIHFLIESLRRAFADRANIADPAFVRCPVDALTSKKYARARASDIDPLHATAKLRDADLARAESPETTHFTIIDEQGNIVTNTYTLDSPFGSSVVATGTGVLLNDEMDDFTAAPGAPNFFGLIQSEANAIAPGKRPVSSMTPAIVLRDGKPLLAIGSPGGPTIVSTVLQVIVNTVDYGMNLAEAIDASRFHHQYLPDEINWEPYGISKETRAALEARGHRFAVEPRYIGDAQGIAVDEKTGLRYGASDPRLDGAALGF